MPNREFNPGFRLSKIDVLVLIVGVVGSLAVASVDRWLGAAIAFVVLHFFLFCNVVRMARPSELVWAGLFTVLAGATAVTGRPGWPWSFGIALTATVLLVVWETRKSSYHGVLWGRLNPELPEWWARQQGESN